MKENLKDVKIFRVLLPLLLCFLAGQPAFAQDAEMADVMRSNGKIYVVLAIALIVLAGMIVYLFTIDRKISRLEQESRKSAGIKP